MPPSRGSFGWRWNCAGLRWELSVRPGWLVRWPIVESNSILRLDCGSIPGWLDDSIKGSDVEGRRQRDFTVSLEVDLHGYRSPHS